MDFIDKVEGMKRIGLARSSCRPPDIKAAYSSGWTEDHGAPCGSCAVLSAPDPETWYICDGVVHMGLPRFKTVKKVRSVKDSSGQVKKIRNLKSWALESSPPLLLFTFIPTSIPARSQGPGKNESFADCGLRNQKLAT
jgi:hypothetical protein